MSAGQAGAVMLLLLSPAAPMPLRSQQPPMPPECAPLLRRVEAGINVEDSLHFVAVICRDSAAPALARYLWRHRAETDTATFVDAVHELRWILPRDSIDPLLRLARDRHASIPVRLHSLVAATNAALPLLGWTTQMDYDELMALPAGATCKGVTAIRDGFASESARRRSERAYQMVLRTGQALAADSSEGPVMRTAGRCAAAILGRLGPPPSPADTLPVAGPVHTAARLRLRNICGNRFGIRSSNLGMDTVLVSVDSEPPVPVVVPGPTTSRSPTRGEITFTITDGTTVTMRWRGEVIQRATLGDPCED